jgi:hypothetical protein
MHERWLWARDWAVIGGVTSWIAPRMEVLGQSWFAVTCGVLGAASGAVVGLALFALLSRAPRRTWVSLCLTVVPLILGAWGATVATVGAWFHHPDLFLLGMPCGSVAAVLQTAWLAPLYVIVARRGGVRLPVVLAASVVGAPLVGGVSVLTGFYTMVVVGQVFNTLFV